MLKDPQTPRYAQRRTHRTYTPQFKAALVAMCHKPGASIAAIAQQHGMNANLLHRWRKEWAQGLHRLEGPLRQTSCRLPFHADDPRQSDTTCKRINIRQSS